MGMTPLGIVHFVLALLCLALGVAIFSRRKGTRSHKRIGISYLAGMLLVNVSALMTYEDSPTFGPFHWLAIMSLTTIACGCLNVIFKRPRRIWVEMHAYFFCWSYAGLLAAGVSQIITEVEILPMRIQVLLPSLLILGIGGTLIHTRIPGVLRRWRGSA